MWSINKYTEQCRNKSIWISEEYLWISDKH